VEKKGLKPGRLSLSGKGEKGRPDLRAEGKASSLMKNGALL